MNPELITISNLIARRNEIGKEITSIVGRPYYKSSLANVLCRAARL